MRPPEAYPRRILAATLGLFPQVLTETLYAIAAKADPAFVPTEIHIVTTAKGAEAAAAALLGPGGRLAAFAQDYGVETVAHALTPERLHAITGAGGAPLDDIETDADNMAAADMIASLIQELTNDPDSALHVSIAGGRKTMGFFLGYALSLYGRPQDRLSHVLVDVRLETHPAFYYPRPQPESLTDRAGRAVSADGSLVSLADIPFVRLRDGLPKGLLAGGARYSETITAADARFQPPSLRIDLAQGMLHCHGRAVKVGGAELAFAAVLAARRRDGAVNGGALHWREAATDTLRYAYLQTPQPLDRILKTLHGDAQDTWFAERVSRFNEAVETSLGPLADLYQLKRFGKRPTTRTGFDLPPECIEINGL